LFGAFLKFCLGISEKLLHNNCLKKKFLKLDIFLFYGKNVVCVMLFGSDFHQQWHITSRDRPIWLFWGWYR